MMAQEKLRPEDIDSAIAQTTQVAKPERTDLRVDRGLDEERGPQQTDWLDERDDEADIPDFPDGDFRVEDDDAVAVSPPAQPRRTLPVVFGGVGLLVVAALVWWMFRPVSSGVEEVPVVTAEPGDVKTKPADEGGMDVPGRDLTVYGQIGSQPEPAETATVLPPPEAPMAAAPATESAATPESGTATDSGATTDTTAPAGAAPATTEPAEPATDIAEADLNAVLAEMKASGAASAPPATEATATPATTEVQPAAGSEPTQTAALPEAAPAPAEPAEAPAAAATGGAIRIQLASFKSESQAQDATQRLQSTFEELSGQSFRVERADLGAKGIYYRVQAGPLASRDEATAVCGRLKQRGQPCILVTP
jgi:cell division septation protein DedD